jgi:hypothetical protein
MTPADWTQIKNAANSFNDDGSAPFNVTKPREFELRIFDYRESLATTGATLATTGPDLVCSALFQVFTTLKGLGEDPQNLRPLRLVSPPNRIRRENDRGLGYFDEALSRDWYIGASGSDDNHQGTWGTRSDYPMAVLATEKTRAAIFDAMKARRFYSTADKNLVVFFTADGTHVGSKILDSSQNIAIDASDGDGESFESIKLIRNGVLVQQWSPSTTNSDVTVTQIGDDGDYFYVIVTQSGGYEAILSTGR